MGLIGNLKEALFTLRSLDI